MPESTPLFTIVLAAGKGRRMRNRYMHKVCFDIAGVPTIVRALDTYNRLGVLQNVIVVGEMAGQVVETVGERFSNVVFAYQPDALGTGDAARCGLQALAAIERPGAGAGMCGRQDHWQFRLGPTGGTV